MATLSPTKKLMKTPAAKAVAEAAEAAEAAPETPKAAAKTVTKAATKPAAKTVEKIEPAAPEAAATDVIAQTAKQIENLKSGDKAFDMIRDLSNDIDRNYFRLGGYLSKIASEGWYQDKGFDNFKGWCEAEGGMAYRKAMYLITIYNGLVESGVPWEKVGHLGWTKLKELAPILTVDNVDEWVAVAEQQTVLQLQASIKAATKGTNEGQTPNPTEDAPKEVSTKTFKLHADQRKTVEDAIEKAKHEGNTEFDAVALEYICMDFLSGGKGSKKPQSLQQVMKGKSIEEVLEAIDAAYPLVVVQAALYDTPEEAAEAKAEAEAQAEAEGEAEGDSEATEETAES